MDSEERGSCVVPTLLGLLLRAMSSSTHYGHLKRT